MKKFNFNLLQNRTKKEEEMYLDLTLIFEIRKMAGYY